MYTRDTDPLRHLSVQDRLRRRYITSECHYLDDCHCVGGLLTVSRSLGWCKTLQRNATTFGRRHYWGLFHGDDQNSHILLYEVSSHCEYGSLFLLKDWTC